MTKTLEEIIARVSPLTYRQSLEGKRSQFEKALSDAVASYSIEAANPILAESEEDSETRANILERLERQIRTWDWAIDEVTRRLEDSDSVLRGDTPPSDEVD